MKLGLFVIGSIFLSHAVWAEPIVCQAILPPELDSELVTVSVWAHKLVVSGHGYMESMRVIGIEELNLEATEIVNLPDLDLSQARVSKYYQVGQAGLIEYFDAWNVLIGRVFIPGLGIRVACASNG